ncbi:MAG: NYN domain-containing protein [Thiobacillus sp.]|nr:NYN domain-containing protein [Thiobacillus sp.]
MIQPQSPVPSLGRMMVFIDGENLVARYQSMVESGRRPLDYVRHRKDTYVWSFLSVEPKLNVVSRATYYTYAIGSADLIDEIASEIQAQNFQQYSIPGGHFTSWLLQTLYPRVFSKPKNRSGKGVDIQMTVDVLANVYQNNLDTVYLVSGDGDYAPLIHEAQRMGKHVFVAALSSGLNPKLKLIADGFICLDNYYFEPEHD